MVETGVLTKEWGIPPLLSVIVVPLFFVCNTFVPSTLLRVVSLILFIKNIKNSYTFYFISTVNILDKFLNVATSSKVQNSYFCLENGVLHS